MAMINPKKLIKISPQKAEEIEHKLEEVGKEWGKVQKEWEAFKKDWWKVFSVITSIMFFISVIRHGFRLELYIWLILMIIFTIVSFYFYKEKSKEIEYLKKIGLLKKDGKEEQRSEI